MSDIAIRAENLGKSYRLGEVDPHATFRELIRWGVRLPGRMFRRSPKALMFDDGGRGRGGSGWRDNEIWALKDVSFEVKRGEVVGVIGRNGAGKSTLLKILTQITKPTTGRAEIHGRVGSLLEVGTGFHPELTGRENIFLNGAILGMRRQEIKRKFDEIVDFSGVERFLDTPVKRYSSGMRVRLAFAVAAHLDPEILLIDEVLAVGDAEFQKRCLGKMHDVAQGGRTVLFVSHNMAAVHNLCGSSMLLSRGKIETGGDTDRVVSAYMGNANTITNIPLHDRTDRRGSGEVRFTSLDITDGHDTANEIAAGRSIGFRLGYTIRADTHTSNCSLTIYSHNGTRLIHLNTEFQGFSLCHLNAHSAVNCTIAQLPLLPGEYFVNIAMNGPQGAIDHIENAARFRVIPSDLYGSGKLPSRRGGHVFCSHSWELSDG
ncbi:MAG: ABC transporter ATP-binding protein [Planctomycetota bacterium]